MIQLPTGRSQEVESGGGAARLGKLPGNRVRRAEPLVKLGQTCLAGDKQREAVTWGSCKQAAAAGRLTGSQHGCSGLPPVWV